MQHFGRDLGGSPDSNVWNSCGRCVQLRCHMTSACIILHGPCVSGAPTHPMNTTACSISLEVPATGVALEPCCPLVNKAAYLCTNRSRLCTPAGVKPRADSHTVPRNSCRKHTAQAYMVCPRIGDGACTAAACPVAAAKVETVTTSATDRRQGNNCHAGASM
jgi:hypothetical protein